MTTDNRLLKKSGIPIPPCSSTWPSLGHPSDVARPRILSHLYRKGARRPDWLRNRGLLDVTPAALKRPRSQSSLVGNISKRSLCVRRLSVPNGLAAPSLEMRSNSRTPPVKTAPPVCCIRHDFGDWRLAGGVVVGSWRAARGRRLCGEVLLPVGLPVPGEKLVQTGLRQVGDTVEDIGEPGLRVDVVQLGGADEGVG